jgi:hypothetical protein
MKMLFTAEMRPRMESGVTSCSNECRMTTLTLSNTPVRKSMARESQRECDKPKMIVAAPKPVTHHSSVLPACFIGGR